MAEDEHKRIKERQEEGSKVATKKVSNFAETKILIDENFKITYTQWKEGKITAVKAMKLFSMKSNTFYRRVKKYESS